VLHCFLAHFIQGRRGPAARFGDLAGERHKLEACSIRDPTRPPRAGRLCQSLFSLQGCLPPPFGDGLLGDLQAGSDSHGGVAPMGHQRNVRAEYIPLRTRFLSNQGLKEAALLIGKKHVVSWTSAPHVSSLAGAGYLHKLFTELSNKRLILSGPASTASCLALE